MEEERCPYKESGETPEPPCPDMRSYKDCRGCEYNSRPVRLWARSENVQFGGGGIDLRDGKKFRF